MKEHITSPASGELLDIVDEQGEPTGQTAEKHIVHALGLRHRDVHVWITNGREVLQQQRTWDKTIMPGAWDISVGGHVAAGESYLEAAVRETGEELGLWLPPERFIQIGRLATQLEFPGWQAAHNIVGDNFVVVEPTLSLDSLRLQAEEVLGARWYGIDQLEADLARPDTAARHAPQPAALYALGIAGLRETIAAL
ncbi:MAG TPA: NUDIX domain-containing protein [Candidatus Saccharimonadales bacterium]|nr:NUDIX domain-containing protein [Candidatus Saccharimonadales bacterium]